MLGHDVRTAMEDQVLNQAAATSCKTSVRRNDHATSARRWVWELLQNAVDSTAESGDDVDVEVALAGDWLTFQHAGGPFSTENLGALITGGSSKPLQSARYTGQFGSGFLVSHVLSHEVWVEGLVESGGQQREFAFSLDRSGETLEAIRANINACLEALDEPTPPTTALGGRWRARFCYRIQHHPGFPEDRGRDERQHDAAEDGLRALEGLLPYVFAFAPASAPSLFGMGESEPVRGKVSRRWKR